MDQQQSQALTVPAGTIIKIGGMPFQPQSDTPVMGRAENLQFALSHSAEAHTGVGLAGAGLTEGQSADCVAIHQRPGCRSDQAASSEAIRKRGAEFAARMLERLGFEGAIRHLGDLRELQLHRAKLYAENNPECGLADMADLMLDSTEFIDEAERIVLDSHVKASR